MTITNPGATEDMWRETPRGQAADIGVLCLPGVDVVRSFLPGGGSFTPPVAHFSGRRLVSADPGRVVFSLPKVGWYLSPKGAIHPGVLAFLADAPLTGAIQSMLPARTVCTTAELSMTFCTSVPGTGGTLTAEGRCIHVDAEMGLAEVFVTDDDGTLVAHGTSRTVVHPPIPDEVALVVAPAAPPEVDDVVPDPYARPVSGGVSTPGGTATLSGLDLLRGVADGVLPRPPIDRLFGVRLVSAEPREVVFEMPAHGWLANEFGTVYGGALAFFATSAASAAVQTLAKARTGFSALDLKVNFLRPTPTDGQTMTATGTIMHPGGQLVVSSGVLTHGGKTIAIATGTTALHPGARS